MVNEDFRYGEQLIQFNDRATYERMMGRWTRLAGDFDYRAKS